MLRAEFSIAPLLFLAAFAFISSLSKRKQRGAPRLPAADDASAPAPDAGFMSELRRAMKELEQAQQQQAVGGSLKLPGAKTPEEQHAAKWLAEQKGRKAGKAVGRVRSVRAVAPVEHADPADDPSSESVASLEGSDYDNEAEKIIAARRQAAEHRVQRVDESSESLSLLQQARRASRPDLVIGGAAEHAEWHGEIGKKEGQGGQKEQAGQRGRLGKYADGTARSAMILSEILRPPLGQREQ